MVTLNKTLLKKTDLSKKLNLPPKDWDKLPEKVLQFGTGVLLRGLIDYYFDHANRNHVFNGRIVVVKTTNNGPNTVFTDQNGLYTIHNKGISDGINVNEIILVSAISRVLNAVDQWDEVLEVAISPDLKIIVSNTTEIGIVMDDLVNLNVKPPNSFPAKVLDVLYRRYLHFEGDMEMGLVILPTELISENGKMLKDIILASAEMLKLPSKFIHWIKEANDFCNTLVDRIVPGHLSAKEQLKAEKHLGFSDQLSIMTDPFNLWAIESTSERVQERLSIAKVNPGIVIAPDIWKFKELKLRLLNGSHTFSCALAILADFDTVRQAMNNDVFSTYVKTILIKEIVPTILNEQITEKEAITFANEVINRFSNPFLDHRWMNISLNFTSKMQMRNIALIQRYFEKYGSCPPHMALGFAAYITFMRCEKDEHGNFLGNTKRGSYFIDDPKAVIFHDYWTKYSLKDIVVHVLKNETIWQTNLNQIPGLADQILYYLELLNSKPALEVIKELNH